METNNLETKSGQQIIFLEHIRGFQNQEASRLTMKKIQKQSNNIKAKEFLILGN